MKPLLSLAALATCLTGLSHAQDVAPASPSRPAPALATHKAWPTASDNDVKTIPGIVHAFYAAISAPAGGQLDRNRLQSLFAPGGRIVISLAPREGHPADVLYVSPLEYAASSDQQTKTEGFFDRNPANAIEHFGVMAHVYSTYESRAHENDAQPEARGVKSFELLNSNNRWYIVQVYWDAERPGNPLPTHFLHDRKDEE